MDTTLPVPTPPMPPVPPPVAPAPQGTVYAGFWVRFGASLLDSLILGVCSFTITFTTGIMSRILSGNNESSVIGMIISVVGSLINLTVSLGYYIYFIGKSGQTPGKSALHIKVVDSTTYEVPGYGTAALRETIGKFASSIVLCLGYLWMLWDEKKQTWHDKIAHTIVIRL